MKNRSTALGVLVIGTMLAASATAQTPSLQERAAAIEGAHAESGGAEAVSYNETTEVAVKGEVKKTEQKQCYYGADGEVQKTPIGASAAPPAEQGGGRRGRGRLKQAVVENKVEDMKYMENVAALVHGYVPPNPPEESKPRKERELSPSNRPA